MLNSNARSENDLLKPLLSAKINRYRETCLVCLFDKMADSAL